jgi:FMN phosphatase YigB (HAD superfamily)
MLLRRLKSWLKTRSANALESLGLSVALGGMTTVLVGLIVVPVKSSDMPTVGISIATGLGTSLIVLGIGIYLTPNSTQPPVSDAPRNAMAATLATVVRDASRSKEGLRICGIANTDFFSPGSKLREPLCELLQTDTVVRVLLLDPDSNAAHRRQQWLGTTDAIRQGRTEIRRLRETYKTLQFRQHQVPACYLCINSSEVVGHPYFTSVDGHDTPIFHAYAGSPTYQHARSHFENLWGKQRWAFIDLGNVLLRFDHQRVANGICASSTTSSTAGEVHKFIFDEGRNAQLDLGGKDIPWLAGELNRKFAFSPALDADSIVRHWCTIFDQAPVASAIQCLADLKSNNVKLALCSNTNEAHWKYVKRTQKELIRLFDEVFLSYELRQVKTMPGFWETARDATKARDEDCFLVDDLQECIDEAKKSGVRGKLISDPEKMRSAFEDIGWI